MCVSSEDYSRGKKWLHWLHEMDFPPEYDSSNICPIVAARLPQCHHGVGASLCRSCRAARLLPTRFGCFSAAEDVAPQPARPVITTQVQWRGGGMVSWGGEEGWEERWEAVVSVSSIPFFSFFILIIFPKNQTPKPCVSDGLPQDDRVGEFNILRLYPISCVDCWRWTHRCVRRLNQVCRLKSGNTKLHQF